ncbi:MAG: dephospho-CoA kinase [Candidatus Nanopelagicus sp.]|jgi:dephospho-CoA kinase|nr:dephospho-CoA kinase [Candidatus Nanopelagicus sp.]
MLTIALTGGIGSGKTAVGEILANFGAVVIDSDQLARQVVERGTPGFDQIVAQFGDEILKNGDLDRAALASLIFTDPKKRLELEQITHPLIRQEFAKIIKSLPEDAIVVNQIPLLVESKHDYKFDYIVTVSTSEEIRVARLLKRGLTKDQITKRIQAQAIDSEREVIADLIIKNEKSQEELFTQVEKLWELLQSKNKAK